MTQHWRPASEPPQGEHGKWSRMVIAVTNLGNVQHISCFHGGDGTAPASAWQRPHGTAQGEHPQWWCDMPANVVIDLTTLPPAR